MKVLFTSNIYFSTRNIRNLFLISRFPVQEHGFPGSPVHHQADLVASTAEQLLCIRMTQVACIVLADLRDDISPQQFAVRWAAHLDLQKRWEGHFTYTL